jgi:hypothetical protein
MLHAVQIDMHWQYPSLDTLLSDADVSPNHVKDMEMSELIERTQCLSMSGVRIRLVNFTISSIRGHCKVCTLPDHIKLCCPTTSSWYK